MGPVFTCSGCTPIASTRAGNRRSSGKRLSIRTGHGGRSGRIGGRGGGTHQGGSSEDVGLAEELWK